MREIRTWQVIAINREQPSSQITAGDFYSVHEAASFVAAYRPAAKWRRVEILSRQKHFREAAREAELQG